MKKYKIYSILAIGSLLLSSCNKFLDLVPEKDITTVETLLSNARM